MDQGGRNFGQKWAFPPATPASENELSALLGDPIFIWDYAKVWVKSYIEFVGQDKSKKMGADW